MGEYSSKWVNGMIKAFWEKFSKIRSLQKFQENCQKFAFCKIGDKDSYVLELIDCVVYCIVLI